MMPVVKSYLDELTKNDMNYFPIEEQDGKTVVTVGIALSNTNIRVMVIFDEDGKSAAIRCYGLLRVTQEQCPMALLACNELNKQKRWVKFLIDDDNDVNLEDDAVIGDLALFQIVERQYVIVLHLEVAAVVVEGVSCLAVVAGIDVEFAVKHIG